MRFSKNSFALLSVALLSVASLAPRVANATVYTWRDTGTTWNTGTNWVGLAVPVSSTTNSLLFNGAGGTTQNNIGGTFTQGSVDFGGSAGAYTLTGNAVRLGSITNNSSNTQTFNLGITQTSTGTYDTNTGKIVVAGAFTGSPSITKTGSGEIEFTTSGKLYSGTLTADAGTVRFTNSGFNNGNLVLANSSNFTSTGNSGVNDFTATGSGSITVGEGGIGTLNATNFDLSGFSGTTSVNSDAEGSFDSISATNNTFGGNLAISLDYTPTNFDRLLGGESWAFFSALASSGNFNAVSLTVGGQTYNLANSSGFWSTTGPLSGFSPTQGFFFSTVDTTLNIGGETVSVAAGTLYAVPEPSTIVFAGIGAAMFGWSTWTRRRAKARRQAIEAAIA